MESKRYTVTKVACYLGYITQAIAINLLPLMYVTFQTQFSVSLTQLGLMATILFVTQIVVDLLAFRFNRYLSYRTGCIVAHICSTAGLIGMCFLPKLMPDPYVGILLAALLLAIGGGLDEVLISPVIDAIPCDAKAGNMSLLHSFYCWGVVGVVLLSTAFFAAFGTFAWQWLVLLWALVPLATTMLFCVVPLPPKPEEQGDAPTAKSGRIWATGAIWLLMALMLFSGATELAPAQWVSLFAEKGLGVTKSFGDLLGPCAFAFFQGLSRILYARLTLRHDPRRLLMLCGLLCVISYAAIVLTPWPFVSLLGFCLCGLAVGPMWPGVLSLASERFPAGGTGMFAVLALMGDIGGALAPAMVGTVSDALQTGGLPLSDALKGGLGVSALFPILLFVGLALPCRERTKSLSEKS